jgi:hypothetical protein
MIKMDVWRRKPGAAPAPPEPASPPSDDGARAAVASAVALVQEINVLLGVANDSRDFHTKTVRLASAKQKLSELQAVVSLHPFMRITSLAEVQAGIARIESELLDYRLQSDGDGAIWVFHAGLYLDTPLDELLYHGIVERGPRSGLSQFFTGASRSRWSLALPTLREMGCDVDDPPQYVASDIGAIPANGGRFLGFLMVFRKIVESGNSTDRIEDALDVFSGRDEFTAEVFEKLGPAKLMMRRAGIL